MGRYLELEGDIVNDVVRWIVKRSGEAKTKPERRRSHSTVRY